MEQVLTDDYDWIAIADITDYYNQIYHHVLANQLLKAGVPKLIVTLIEKRFLSTLTHGVSRGIPIGPHSVHLLAESALTPVDESLRSRQHNFCRYADDYHFFCRSKEKAQIALYDFAEILDKQQRLTVQKQKVQVIPRDEFIEHANAMLIDRPLNDEEEEILQMIGKYNSGPYERISLSQLDVEDLKLVESDVLTSLFDVYLDGSPRNYPRIGWLLRRLAQVGAPGAVDFVLANINELTPVLGDAARYIMRASQNYASDLKETGKLILDALDHPLIEHGEYVQMVLLNLFASIPQLDHIHALTARYQQAPPSVRREILIAASIAGESSWIKERKDEFNQGDVWIRRALAYALPSLPGDEAVHWLNKIKNRMSGLEKFVVRWRFKDEAMKLGDIKIS